MLRNAVNIRTAASYVLAMCVLAGTALGAQAITQRQGTATNNSGTPKPTPTPTPTPEPLPATYVIGADDLLTVITLDEKDLTGDVLVRADGKITMLHIGEMQAAGLTPKQLQDAITAAIQKIVRNPSVTVIVKQSNSRWVYITGTGIIRPGRYPLGAGMGILELLTLAGGIHEFADEENILVIRGKQAIQINYKEIRQKKNLQKNLIDLLPGDRVIVSGGDPLGE